GWTSLSARMEGLRERLQSAQAESAEAEGAYRSAETEVNEAALQTARQQSRVAALEQEERFKANQLETLLQQVAQNREQLGQTSSGILEAGARLETAEAGHLELLRRKE